jgi:antitoxin ParD1/3/4
MNVHLTAELEEFVQKKVQSGLYDSASEVVREALRLLARRDAADRLEDLLLEGLDSGEAREMTADDWRELRSTVRERLARHG